jgi:hypothetical protein
MSILDDFKKYRDKFGLNQLDSDGQQGLVTQNGALFTMEYLITLLGNDSIHNYKKRAEIRRLIKVYESLEVFPGVSVRYPNDKEFDSMDNTCAIMTFSALFDNGAYSKRAYEHGSKTRAEGISRDQDAENSNKYYKYAFILNCFRAPRFFWNNNDPKKFCFFGWHGRSPAHIALLKMTAGKFVGPFGLISIVIGQFLGCFADKKDSDARKLSYVNWQYLKTRNIIWKSLYSLWCFILLKQYANGMKDVYKMYYNNNPEHPIITYSKPFEA